MENKKEEKNHKIMQLVQLFYERSSDLLKIRLITTIPKYPINYNK